MLNNKTPNAPTAHIFSKQAVRPVVGAATICPRPIQLVT